MYTREGDKFQWVDGRVQRHEFVSKLDRSKWIDACLFAVCFKLLINGFAVLIAAALKECDRV